MKRSFIFCLCLIMMACGGVKTSYNLDKTVTYTKYQTYNYAPHVSESLIVQSDKDKIIEAIDGEMYVRRYSKSANPDVLIDIHLRTRQEAVTSATAGMFPPWGYRFAGGFNASEIPMEKYKEGTLFINVIDNSLQRIIWQGRGNKVISKKGTDEKRINKAVKKIFKDYPIEEPKR